MSRIRSSKLTYAVMFMSYCKSSAKKLTLEGSISEIKINKFYNSDKDRSQPKYHHIYFHPISMIPSIYYGKLIVIPIFIETDRTEMYTIKFLPLAVNRSTVDKSRIARNNHDDVKLKFQ